MKNNKSSPLNGALAVENVNKIIMKNLMTVLAVVFVGINIYAVKHFGDFGLIPKDVFFSLVWGSVVATVITISTASTIYFMKKLK